jgi:hypothetical protein
MLGKKLIFLLFLYVYEFNRYIRRRDLHTVLPKHAVSASNNSPRLSKTMAVEDKLDANLSLKRPKLNSTSSDSGIVADSEVDTKVKRQKLEEINESSPKTMESNSDTV